MRKEAVREVQLHRTRLDEWVAVTAIGRGLHIPAGHRSNKLSWLELVMLVWGILVIMVR